jgi:hypothetical protein
VTVKFNQSIFFARESVVSFISGAYLVHNKKIRTIDSDSESDEEMSYTTAKGMNKCLIRRRTS